MRLRIAINGMGRIGRLLFRRLLHQPDCEIVAVNDLMTRENLAYLLRYDSIYGTLPEPVELEGETLKARGQDILVLQQANPVMLPWKQLNVDVVLECTGRFHNRLNAMLHLQAGARKVLLSTTGSDDIPLLIFGYNQQALTADVDILSPGGCMTNCAVPLLDVLMQTGIESAQVHFQHSYTSRQQLVDAPHAQFRRGRAAAESIIPVEIDLAQSLNRLMPELDGRLAAISTRVPVANGALGDFTVQLAQPLSTYDIRNRLAEAARNRYYGIIDFTDEPLVSLDIKGNTHSSVVEGPLISVAGRQAKILAWFDNEFGYTSRILDWLHYWRPMIPQSP